MKEPRMLFGILLLTIGISLQAQAQSPFTNGLIAYYPFNGNANNAAGPGFNGTVNGAQASTNRFGHPNSAYLFNGTGNYIFVGDQLPDSQQFTLSVWIKPDEDKLAGIFYEAAYFTPGRDTILQTYPGAELHGTATKIASPGPNSLIASGVISIGVWKHVVWTLRTNGTAIYVNGTIAASTNYPGNNVGYHSPMYFGAENHGLGVESFFHGSIDDVRIYNRALSVSEVQQLYAYESRPRVDLIKAVKPTFSNLTPGLKYQLQASLDLNTWYDQGLPFTATSTNMAYPWYYDVDSWDQLFFRLHVSP